MYRYVLMDTVIGPLLIVGDQRAIREVRFQQGQRPAKIEKDWKKGGDLVEMARKQLEEYLAGERRFFDVPVEPAGTPFQKLAWRVLREIPYGETRSYSEQARAMGYPRACRAVGAANGRNPIPIVIPCHRVVGSQGHLTGYAGGLHIKKYLLGIERDNERSHANSSHPCVSETVNVLEG